MESNAHRSPAGFVLLGALMLALAAVPAAALQEPDGQAAKGTGRSVGGELEELGTTLKAAVISGSLSEEEAIKIWQTMNERLRAGRADADEAGSAKRDVMLSAPRPERLRALLRFEFLRRDLQVFRDELGLDREQMTIAALLLSDYLEAYDLASSPLREALGRYRRTATNQWLAAALDRARIVDAVVAEEKIRRTMEQWSAAGKGGEDEVEQKRAAVDMWTKRMVDATRNMEDRLALIRARVGSDLAALEGEGVTITAEDVIRLAKQLRADREQLRTEMTASLEAIINEEQLGAEHARFHAAMARVRIGHLLPRGRLGGESMDLWAAMMETSQGEPIGRPGNERLGHAEALLESRASWIAEKLDERTEATLDREVDGLEFQARRDRIDVANGALDSDERERRLANAIRSFADAAQREVTASVIVRDALLALLDESTGCIEETSADSDLSARYRETALRRGFPNEMRRRWSERAIAAALELDDLDDEVTEALLVIQSATATELQILRDDSIAKRIERDPKLARDQVEARYGGENSEFSKDIWLGLNHEAFASIDDRTERQLRALLTPDQLRSLPRRKSTWERGADKDVGKGKGKGNGDRR